MKLFKVIAATACALAIASAAHAATYTDSSANYPDGWDTGSNGGTGFGAWVIESAGSSWSGIWPLDEAGLKQGGWAEKDSAFALVARGDESSITATRAFRAALAPEDSFSLEMGVNYDGNREGSTKGFALTANGETIVTVNHESSSVFEETGKISINGDQSSAILNAYGTQPMTWTFIAKDATTLSVTATARDDSSKVYSADLEGLSTSAIDGFRLQSAQQTSDDVKERQSYYDNFTLNIAADLPELVDLGFTAGEWAVSNATQTLSYTLSRSSSDAALDVTVKSSDESFVPSAKVSFAAGESEKSFTLDATLTGSGNFAKLTASATGCNPATYEVKGPQYRMSAGAADLFVDDTVSLWINWDNNGIRDDSKLALVADPEGIISVPSDWSLPTEGDDIYVETSVTALADGYTLLALTYDGVKMADWGFTVTAPHFTISGPKGVTTGKSYEYKVSGKFPGGPEKVTVSVTEDATLDPADGVLWVYASDDPPATFKVTFGESTDPVTLSVTGNYPADPFVVTVSEPADYSKFIAYDDASLYSENFDAASTGEGQRGFEAWREYQAEAQNGGVFVGEDVPEALSGILEGGKVLGLYANGEWENNNYKMYRGFGGDIEAGQEFAIDFACQATGGSRFVQVSRWWEGTAHPRFEVYTSDGFVGVNLEGFEVGDIGWPSADRVVHVSVLRSADGSTYTLSLTSGSDSWSKDVPASTENWGDGLQGFIVGAWNSGSDLYFNRMSIAQVEEPIVARTIGWLAGVWNPDAAGEYKFAISATTDDIGVVALAVEPSDGALSLSTDSVDLTGVTETSFAVILSEEAKEGDSFKITATPADTTVDPIEYNVTVSGSYVTLSCDNWEFPVSAGEIWLALSTSVSKYGTYTIFSDDEAVLSVPEDSQAITVNSPDQYWFNVKIEGVGSAKIFATLGENSAEYGFTIIPGAVEIPAPAVVKGKGLSWKASDLAGFTLRGTATLGDPPTTDSWSDLVEGVDYETDGENITVLYTSAYNYIAIVAK